METLVGGDPSVWQPLTALISSLGTAGVAVILWRLHVIEQWKADHGDHHEAKEAALDAQDTHLREQVSALNEWKRASGNGHSVKLSDVQHTVNDALQGHVLQDHDRR